MSPAPSNILTRLRRIAGEMAYRARRMTRRLGGWGTTTQVVALVTSTLAASILILSLLHMRARVDSAYAERSQFTVRQAWSVGRFLSAADGDIRSPRGLEQIQRFSEYIGMVSGPSSFLFVDLDGLVLAHSNADRIGERHRDSGVAKALAGDEVIIGKEEDERTGHVSLDVAAPVRYRGAVVGAVVAHFPLESLEDELAASQQAASVSALIIALFFVPASALVVARFQRTLERMAITEALTGLYQHSYFLKMLSQEVRRSSRYEHEFSLILFDIDEFKEFNDTYGHLAGDDAILSVARSLKQSIREVDLPARYGGDELVAILPHTGPEQAYVVSERIREGVRAATNGKEHPLTVSLGIASYPSNALTAEDLIRCADLALYHAKQTGKNRSCLYSRMPKSQPSVPVIEES